MTEDTPVQRPRKLINEVVALRRTVRRLETAAYLSLAMSCGIMAGIVLVIAWTLIRR